jgi:hypothetical protein
MKEKFATFYYLIKDHACQMYIKAGKDKIEKRIIWYESRPR